MSERKKLLSALTEMFERSSSPEDFNASAEIVKRKIAKGMIYPGITESEFYKTKISAVMGGKSRGKEVPGDGKADEGEEG